MDFNILTILSSAITGVITFFLGIQKNKKEVELMSITNVEKSLDVYKLIIEDLREQIISLLDKVDILESKIDELQKENWELKKMLEDYNKKHNTP
jgi:peptidoglycan hydrolase CwlO-like protein